MRLEGICNIFVSRLSKLLSYGQYIKMDLAIKREIAAFEPDNGGISDSALLPFDHGILGQAVVSTAPVFHFNEMEGFVLARNNIDFAQWTTEIMVHNVVLFLMQVFAC